MAPVAAVIGTLYAVAVLNAVPPHPDFDVYLRGAGDLAHGRPLYDPFLHNPGEPALRYGFIYPPLFAILMVPFTWLPAAIAPDAWLIMSHLALGVAFWLCIRRFKMQPVAVFLAIAVTLAFYPLWVESSQAQANLPILLLVTAGILGISGGNARAGIWIGLATALKLTPGLLIVWLLWERRWRAAAWMGAAFAGVTAVAAVLRPADTVTYARDVLPQLAHGTAYWSNQSIAGLVARLFTSNPYTSPLLNLSWEPLLSSGLVLAGMAFWISKTPSPTLLTRGRETTGLMGIAFLPLLPLASAVSWEHHLVILLPLVWLIIAVLAERGWPLRETAVAAFALLCLLAIPHLPLGPPFATDFARAAHTHNPLLIAGANRLLMGTLILFLAGPWLIGRFRAVAGKGSTDRATAPAAAA